SRAGRPAYMPTDFVAAKEKVCEHMRKVGSTAMKELSGDEFDNAFLKHAAMAHEAAIASIDAVSGNASSELATALKEEKEGLQKHLDAAKELCKARKGK